MRRETAPLGAPCWVDIMTKDPQGARAFYGTLFGWDSEEPNPDFGGYFNFTKDGDLVAGGMPNTMTPMDVWSVYLAVADAAATVEQAAARGGPVVVPAMPVGELGTMGVVTDPGGAVIGMWQPGSHGGFQRFAESGTPSWFELLTRDYDASVPFYRDVFGWETHTASDSAEFRYTTLGEGESMGAGIMDAAGFLPEGVGSHWSVYFGVDATDAALAAVTSLGGSVIQRPENTPYGRLATVADPTGAVFKLVGPST